MAILIVNGKFNYKDHLWIELSIKNIIRFTSPYSDFKIFVWNHDVDNPRVQAYFDSVKNDVEVLSEKNFDLSQWQGVGCGPQIPRLMVFAGGYHVHRGALQMLYDFVTGSYDVDFIFTFDSDSWPIRNNWEVPLVYQLERDIRLTGIWRDELQAVIPPYVHPSCLGIKAATVAKLNLRFDYEPIPPREDTLSHFTYSIREHFGSEVILPLKRSNSREYHSVFNGVYGFHNGIIYHHHLGSRYRDGKISQPKTYGWQERGESPEDNKFILDATTYMIFEQTEHFIHDLVYGDRAFDFNLYLNYLKNDSSEDSYCHLLKKAKAAREKNLWETYFISGLICKHFAFDKEFLEFYGEICEEMGFNMEAESYYHLARSQENACFKNFGKDSAPG